ncbi:uncharacterized protein LAESUDRAFT_17824 [Laetiporus sulphureus 93-53]|uniref:DUF6534 domain-containing protein n=1 Tax=Laetiporus sulphureus 93-53 TaxID=1314785 RepID=A0A165IAY1_9APHY|nr:uncharacterized protein LAESUDRAFT_17824 [Laetiporus sulphureus 93-53]KZT12825.1 hypothetical protein LAESUDRAFT_17824 [Laetiporus sulphureus 93-53]
MTGPNLHLNDSIGSLFIGVIFAVILYGLGCAQTMYYASWYGKDHMWIKSLVWFAFLRLLDTVRTILDIVVAWGYTVQSHGNPAGLTTLVISFYAEFFLNSVTVLIVQLYFIYSIWMLLKEGEKRFRAPLTVAAILLALLSFSGGCGIIYRANLDHAITAVIRNVKIPASIASVIAVVTDVYITVSLCMVLSSKRTGLKRTEYFISTLIGYAVRRGFFTALVQALHFLTYITTLKQDSLYWMIFHFPASKIYVNAMLAVLNVRKTIRENAEANVYEYGTDMQMHVVSTSAGSTKLTGSSERSKALASQSTPQARIMLTREVIQDDGRVVDISAGALRDEESLIPDAKLYALSH